MKPINAEILLSHSTGISDPYYWTTESELLHDYLRVASDQLTINEVVKLPRENKHEIQQLRRSNAEKTVQIQLLTEKVAAVEHDSKVMADLHKDVELLNS